MCVRVYTYAHVNTYVYICRVKYSTEINHFLTKIIKDINKRRKGGREREREDRKKERNSCISFFSKCNVRVIKSKFILYVLKPTINLIVILYKYLIKIFIIFHYAIFSYFLIKICVFVYIYICI